MKKIKAVLFDLDDTLVQTSKVRYETFKEIGRKYNISLTDEQITEAWTLPMVPFMKALYSDVDTYENLMEYYEIVKDKYPTIPETDAVDTIGKLYNHALLGVVSSASTTWIKHDLSSVGFSLDHFTYIQGAEDSEYHKPDPQVFDSIMQEFAEMEIIADEVLYVGDLLNDYRVANDAGFQFRGLADRTTPHHAFTKAGANTINKISDLLDLFPLKQN